MTDRQTDQQKDIRGSREVTLPIVMWGLENMALQNHAVGVICDKWCDLVREGDIEYLKM